MESSTIVGAERKKRAKSAIVLIVLALLIITAFVVSMNTGFTKLSPLEVMRTLFGGGTAKQELILFEFRLPRIVISVMVGAGLALSGCILQGVSRNALADPGILGINAGAGLVVMLFVSFFPTTTAAPVFLLPILALIGSGFAAFLIYVLSYKKERALCPLGCYLRVSG